MTQVFLVALSTLIAPQGQGHQVQTPPTEAWSNVMSTVQLSEPTDGSVRAAVRIRTDTKSVKISWRLFTAFPDTTTGIVSHTQEFTTRYWPTYACGAGPDAIYVAGQNSAGATILERWDFDASGIVSASPGFEPAPRVTVTQLLLETVTGRSIILQMRPMLHDTSVLMIRYLDSRDLYAFDTQSALMVQIAGPGPSEPSGVLVEPALQSRYSPLFARDHVQYGYVYIFSPGPVITPTASTLVLSDANRDGVLDGSLVLDEAGWEVGGWSDPDNYN